MKTLFNVLKVFCSVSGAIVGAGFLSGAELVCFYGTENFFATAAFASVMFAVTLASFFKCETSRLDGENDVFIKIASYSADFIFLAGCFAALDAVFNKENTGGFPFASVASAVFAFAYSSKGGKGLEKVNAIATPVALAAVNCFLIVYLLKKPSGFTCAQTVKVNVIKPILYVFMNVFAATPALRYVKKDKTQKETTAASILFGAFAFLQSVLILSVAIAAKTAGNTVPVVAAFEGAKYSFVLKIAMSLSVFTSFYSFFLPVYDGASRVGGRKFGGFVVAAAFFLSRAGFSKVIKYLYPAVGAAGVTAFIKILVATVKNKGIKNASLTDNNRKTGGGTLCPRKRKTKLKN